MRHDLRAISRLAVVVSIFSMGALDAHSAPAPNVPFLKNGKAGFVVAHFQYALSRDANVTGAYPKGMTSGFWTKGNCRRYLPSRSSLAPFVFVLTTKAGMALS
jgi:hypothetical protein